MRAVRSYQFFFLSEYGYNELAQQKVNPLLKFLSYFWGPIPWLIEIAVIFSAAVGDWADFIIIFILLLIRFKNSCVEVKLRVK